MSPENDTPQNNDEPTDIIERTIQEELALGGDPKSCASAVRVALKDAGLYVGAPGITGSVEFQRDAQPYVNLTLPGGQRLAGWVDSGIKYGPTEVVHWPPNLGNPTVVDLEGSLMGEALAERIKSGNLDQIAPGASEAAQRGIEIANRSIGFVSQKAAESASGLMEHLDALAAALELIGKQPDVVVVKLPEPDGLDVFDQPKWWETGWDIGVPLPPVDGKAQVRIETSGYLEPDSARLLGAALFAAANAAEAADGAQ